LSNVICHDIYPARGRKPWIFCTFLVRKFRICHDIYPARGRKRLGTTNTLVNSALQFATIFTPQGDGNSLST